MAHESDPPRAAARRARLERRLGTDRSCALCGATDLEALMRSRLEDHHLVGRALDADLTVVLCRNCHSVISAKQSDADALKTPAPDNLVERVVRMLRSIAAFFETFADWLCRFADQLTDLVLALDDHDPAWRLLPAAAA